MPQDEPPIIDAEFQVITPDGRPADLGRRPAHRKPPRPLLERARKRWWTVLEWDVTMSLGRFLFVVGILTLLAYGVGSIAHETRLRQQLRQELEQEAAAQRAATVHPEPAPASAPASRN